MDGLGDLFGAAAVLLFLGLRWALENWRFVLPVALGLWGLFLLWELGRGFEHVSAQLAAISGQLHRIQSAVTEPDVRDAVIEIKDAVEQIAQHVEQLEGNAPDL